MKDTDRNRYLSLALRAFSAVFVLGVYPLTVLWPSGWCWNPGQSEYLHMIIGIYATLGGFLWIASNNPDRHQSLISFTIWSSLVHASVMAVHSFRTPQYFGHLYGDVPALFIVAAVLGWLSPRALKLNLNTNAA